MKTRTLLLWSLACGIAIMLAGAVFLVQVARNDDVEPALEVGHSAEVGDVTVTVVDAHEAGGILSVDVRLAGDAAVGDPSGGFSLIASGRRLRPATSSCGGVPAECTVTFDTSAADGASRALFFDRGDEQAWWNVG